MIEVRFKLVLIIVFLTVIPLLTGCDKGVKGASLGVAIPSDVKVTKLKEIASNLQGYKDKEVVLVGNFNGACCAADFSYKEGLEGIQVKPKGFTNPKARLGQPIRVYGVVRVAETIVGTKREIIAYIEGMGVELR
jgi:hypothetical protein